MELNPPPTRLDDLEEEAVFIIREAVGAFERPVLLFSGGKDSRVLLALVERAFAPDPVPLPLLHVDTGHNFPEVLAYRDRVAAEVGVDLIVRRVEDTLAAGRAFEGPGGSRNRAQATTLKDAVAELGFDALLGGARRDEEKARAKERVFSVRGTDGAWRPEDQRAELWRLFNPLLAPDTHIRVFPLSNWTELDVWSYVQREELELPSLYFSHERQVVRQGDAWLASSDWIRAPIDEPSLTKEVRFRTVGDMTCTGALVSTATTVDEVIAELTRTRSSERSTRVDDKGSSSAMEERKLEGYF